MASATIRGEGKESIIQRWREENIGGSMRASRSPGYLHISPAKFFFLQLSNA